MKVRASHPAIGELTFRVSREPTVLGRRGGSADIDLNWDVLVSRRHARLWEESGEVWFEDLGSRNGCYVGNERLNGAIRLSPNVRVLVGDTMVTLLEAAAETSEVETTYDRIEIPEVPIPLDTPKSYAGLPLPELTGDVNKETLDLRAQVDHGPKARQHTRFVTRERVEVTVQEQESIRTLWIEDISNGGLFVASDSPPPRGTRVEVAMSGPDGQLVLHADVVHVVDAATAKRLGRAAGAGLAFTDLTLSMRKTLQVFVDAFAAQSPERPEPVAPPVAPVVARRQSQVPPRTPPPATRLPPQLEPKAILNLAREAEQVLERARRVLDAFERNDLYGLLEVDPVEEIDRIQVLAADLHTSLGSPPAGLTSGQSARVQAAVRCVERTTALFADPLRRLEYDFRTNHVRVEQRLADSKKRAGIPIVKLRETWNRVFPGSSQRANHLAHVALEARKRRDFRAAIEAGKKALELDPFLEELRHAVGAWAAAIGRGDLSQ